MTIANKVKQWFLDNPDTWISSKELSAKVDHANQTYLINLLRDLALIREFLAVRGAHRSKEYKLNENLKMQKEQTEISPIPFVRYGFWGI